MGYHFYILINVFIKRKIVKSFLKPVPINFFFCLVPEWGRVLMLLLSVLMPGLLNAQSALWTWGANTKGELGNGNSATVLKPEAIHAAYWTALSAGHSFSIGIKPDGTLWSWGINEFNQLGDGANTDRNIPQQIYSASGTAGKWINVSSGYAHSAGIRENGSLWTWGLNTSYQLGDGTYVGTRNLPTRIDNAATGKWLMVDCGYYHNVAIKEDGSLWTWGGNNSGQLGNNRNNSGTNVPTQIGSLSDGRYVKIAAGWYHSLGIKDDGSLWAWGHNGAGQVGDGSFINKQVPVLIDAGNHGKWIAISAGESFSIGIKEDSSLWEWGANDLGQTSGGRSNVPVMIDDGYCLPWKTIDAGRHHALGVKIDGSVWAWGSNAFGQIGSGLPNNSMTPYMIPELSYMQQTILAAGKEHSMVTGIKQPTQLPGKKSRNAYIEQCILKGEVYFFNGISITGSGTYTASYITKDGCDSTATLRLQVIDTVSIYNQITACNFAAWNDSVYRQSTVIKDTIKSVLGCDSIYHFMSIVVNKSSDSVLYLCLPENEIYVFNNQTLDKSGFYKGQFINTNNCDSTVFLYLTIVKKNEMTITGISSVLYNGVVYHSSAILTDTVLNQQGCDSVYNITNINVLPKAPLNIPNAFSPNNDGINDIWTIKNIHLYNFVSLSVFDRYGTSIFECRHLFKPWDGTRNGKPLPVGVYYYVLTINDNEYGILKGSVMLVR